ncbi:MAG: hypothetical protein H7141_01750 [Burkholderiales bacterium]|nr:hypothetical protein [Bacteroidia bacterium]
MYEIGIEYQEIFHKHGAEKIQLLGSLNNGDDWVETILKLTRFFYRIKIGINYY